MTHAEPMPSDTSRSLDADCAEAIRCQIAGRDDLAEPLYRAVLHERPGHGTANYGLGMLLVQRRRAAEAIPHLLQAVNAEPQAPDYWIGYLEALLQLGDVTLASQILALARGHGLTGAAADDFAARLESRRRMELPERIEAPSDLPKNAAPVSSGSTVPAAPGAPSRAARRRRALLLERQETALLHRVKTGRLSDALNAARTMTEQFPDHGTGWKIYAAMLWAVETTDQALPALYKSAELLPRDVECHSNLGTALNKLRRLDEAEQWLKRALEIDPAFAAAHAQLADTFQLQGRYEEAEVSFRRAISLYPSDFSQDNDPPHSGLLFMLNHNPTVSAQQLFDEHCRVGAYLERSVATAASHPRRDPDPERLLQVGLVSADLRNHAVASFIEPLLREWSGSRTLRITVYHCHPAEDEVSRRLRTHVSRWQHVFGLSNGELAHKIAQDGIDILVDLAGHTSMHRLAAFARKPAPVQVSWLGYPGTTGLRAMDYYLADEHFLPAGRFDRYFTEKLVHLPVVWGFEPFAGAPPVNALPALVTGSLCFGSFNRLGKINETTVRLWAALLRQVPGASLKIAGVPLERQHHRLIEWFAQEGITRDRLTFHPYTTLEAHLGLHHDVDIALEPTPYTGCTTSNHALWMGVPPLTLAGATPASRLCAANLGHLGLNRFIADSPEDFVAKGSYWADHLQELAALRSGLRGRWQASPARDPAYVAAGFELGLRRMWRHWCQGLAPAAFEIAAGELG